MRISDWSSDVCSSDLVTAYDYAIYGGLDATLIGISPNTLLDEEGNSYYRVRFRADTAGFAADKPIIPGMTATVDILTGEQTVLDYLLDPLRDALNKDRKSVV